MTFGAFNLGNLGKALSISGYDPSIAQGASGVTGAAAPAMDTSTIQQAAQIAGGGGAGTPPPALSTPPPQQPPETLEPPAPVPQATDSEVPGKPETAQARGAENQQAAFGKIGSALGAIGNFYSGNYVGAVNSLRGLSGESNEQKQKKQRAAAQAQQGGAQPAEGQQSGAGNMLGGLLGGLFGGGK